MIGFPTMPVGGAAEKATRIAGLAVFLVALCGLVLPVASYGQQTASVIGSVSDVTGAVIPGADVMATNNNTGISTARVSGERGAYTIPGLQPGPYTISASLPGFNDSTIEVSLSPNQTFRFNFTLQVGAVATSVEVVSDADALLATTGASVGDVLPESEVSSLPLSSRNVFDLLQTTAGLVRNGDGTNFAGLRNSMVNTTRDGVPVSDGRYLDWNGAYSATYSSPDLVEEVQVSVGTVDSAAGRGSAQVRLQTRSGTNEFHGALFWNVDNSALNANNWFDNLQGRQKDYTNRQQWGGRLGGPIISNKLFFFTLIEFQRYRAKQNVTGIVLTEQARQNQFRYFPGAENQNFLAGPGERTVDAVGNPVLPDAATGDLQSFHLINDVNDAYRTGISSNPFIQETLRRMPLPNDFTVGDGLNTAGITWVRRVSGADNSVGTAPSTNRDQLNTRIDYQATANNRFSFVMSREEDSSGGYFPTWPDSEQFQGSTRREPSIYTASWSSTLSPSVLNEVRFGYRQTSSHGRPSYADGCCFGDDTGPFGPTEKAQDAASYFSEVNGYPFLPALSSLSGTLWLSSPTFSIPISNSNPLWTWSDNVSWVRGTHSFTAGWDGIWADSDGWSGGGPYPLLQLGSGNFPVTGIQGVIPGLADTDAQLAAAILDDLSGSVAEQTMAYFVIDPTQGFTDVRETVKPNVDFHQNDWSIFFKDDWNTTPNLTLNYGVRYEKYGVPWDARGLAGSARDNDPYGISGPTGQLTVIDLVGKNSLNPDRQLYNDDWNNIGPQFGFSYHVPWFARTTVVRGGYGISYQGAPTFKAFDAGDGPGRQPGKEFETSLTPTVPTFLPGATNPDVALPVFPLPLTIEPFGVIPLTDRRVSMNTFASDRRNPYIQNFNLSVETEIAPNTNLSVAWLGTKGTSLWGGRQINEPDILRNGFLDAFITTREGGNAPLFNSMFNGIDFGSGTCRVVNGTTCTGSMVLRQSSRTRSRVANGEAAGLAELINQTNLFTGEYGGLLRANGYPENFIVANPQFNQVDFFGNDDSSSYHALQTQITKRLSSGFSGQFSYTWSKALGNSATSTSPNNEDQSLQTRDPNNRRLQKGLVPFHRTHAFNAHGTWNLPFGQDRALGANLPGWAQRIVEGWTLSSIFSWQSGQPIPLTTSIETLAAEDSLNTPDLIGGISAFPKSLGSVRVGDGTVSYLDGFDRVSEPLTGDFGADPNGLNRFTNLFQIQDSAGNVVLRNPKPGTTGNLSSNWLEGPSRLGLDLALLKAVQIREGTSLTFRMDGINVLNSPIWANPSLDINSSSFGRIRSASGERRFTFNARLDF